MVFSAVDDFGDIARSAFVDIATAFDGLNKKSIK